MLEEIEPLFVPEAEQEFNFAENASIGIGSKNRREHVKGQTFFPEGRQMVFNTIAGVTIIILSSSVAGCFPIIIGLGFAMSNIMQLRKRAKNLQAIKDDPNVEGNNLAIQALLKALREADKVNCCNGSIIFDDNDFQLFLNIFKTYSCRTSSSSSSKDALKAIKKLTSQTLYNNSKEMAIKSLREYIQNENNHGKRLFTDIVKNAKKFFLNDNTNNSEVVPEGEMPWTEANPVDDAYNNPFTVTNATLFHEYENWQQGNYAIPRAVY